MASHAVALGPHHSHLSTPRGHHTAHTIPVPCICRALEAIFPSQQGSCTWPLSQSPASKHNATQPDETLTPALAGSLEVNSPQRARQVRLAIERLGPAYIKVAQAVSTRVDILDVNYLMEIERLQDRVPPFPTPAARIVMAQGELSIV